MLTHAQPKLGWVNVFRCAALQRRSQSWVGPWSTCRATLYPQPKTVYLASSSGELDLTPFF